MINKTENKPMKVTGGEYLTVQDMSKRLGVTLKVVNMRLFRLGIKPISKDALYPISALDAIGDIKMGRPPKKTLPEPVKTKENKNKSTKKR